MAESTTNYGILVAVDGSAESDAAVRWAAREAAMHDAPVTLMHVVAPLVANWAVRRWRPASPNGKRKTRSTPLNRRRRRCRPLWVNPSYRPYRRRCGTRVSLPRSPTHPRRRR